MHGVPSLVHEPWHYGTDVIPYSVQEKGVEPSSEHWKCPIFSRYTTPAFVVGKVGIEPDYLLCIRQMLLPSKLLTNIFL